MTPDWQNFFKDIAEGEYRFPKPRFGPSFRPASIFSAPTAEQKRPGRLADPEMAALQDRVYVLTRLYRVRGHRIAQVDPLGLPRPVPAELTPEFFGFTEADMDSPVYSETFQYDGPLTLGKLLERLRNTYCRSIGVQYMHIDDLSVRRWLQSRMEGTRKPPATSARRAIADPDAADRRGDFRGIHPAKISWREEFFARRLRKPDSAAGPGHRESRPNKASRKSCWAWRTAAG